MSLSIRSETTQKKEEIQTAEIWNQKSHRIHDAVLYQKLSSGDQFSLERIAEKAGEKGIYIEKIEEKEPLMQGIWTIRRIQISGNHLLPYLDFFDIIQDETMWTSLEFHRLERKITSFFLKVKFKLFTIEAPMKKRNIVLIGPMGTGKSRAAKLLADGLEWQLADTDRILEKETGMKMAVFWRSAGPEAFAEKEKKLLKKCAIIMRPLLPWAVIFP